MDLTIYKKNFLNRGFTLLETLIVITIFTLASIMVTSLFIGHSNLFRFSMAEVNSGSGARLSSDRISETIRDANVVLSSYDFSGTTYFSDSDELVLRLKTVNTNNEVLDNTFDYLAYHKDLSTPSNFLETTLANASSRRVSGTRLLTDRLANLDFVYDNASFPAVETVTLEIRTAESFRNTNATSTVRLLAKLRNRN